VCADDTEWDGVRAGDGTMDNQRREEATVIAEARCWLGPRPRTGR